jgi:hypothetical protein
LAQEEGQGVDLSALQVAEVGDAAVGMALPRVDQLAAQLLAAQPAADFVQGWGKAGALTVEAVTGLAPLRVEEAPCQGLGVGLGECGRGQRPGGGEQQSQGGKTHGQANSSGGKGTALTAEVRSK